MLHTFEVIWLFDRLTEPQKWKMMVCLSWDEGWFLRINSSGRFRPCVSLPTTSNPWLHHDSFVECALMEIDEYELQEALEDSRNPLGFVHERHREDVLNYLLQAQYIRQADKDMLKQLLS